jgi:hypothetical protein
LSRGNPDDHPVGADPGDSAIAAAPQHLASLHWVSGDIQDSRAQRHALADTKQLDWRIDFDLPDFTQHDDPVNDRDAPRYEREWRHLVDVDLCIALE